MKDSVRLLALRAFCPYVVALIPGELLPRTFTGSDPSNNISKTKLNERDLMKLNTLSKKI